MTDPASQGTLLVADIGGTNARFALARQTGGSYEIDATASWTAARFPGLTDALDAFLDDVGRPDLSGAAVCGAGPVTGSGADARIALTNSPWKIDAAQIARTCKLPSVTLLNDFEALAMAVPALQAMDLTTIVDGTARPGAARAILGAGTGLGVAALVEIDGHHVTLPSEGGHVDLSATDAREIALLDVLLRGRSHVSAEHVLSGPGLINLHRAIALLDGIAAEPVVRPQDIAERDVDGTCLVSTATIDQFTAWLGTFAGNLALTLGARGGVYIAGGIVPNWVAGRTRGRFDFELFRARFVAKGRFADYLSAIPVHVVTRADPALVGLVRALTAA